MARINSKSLFLALLALGAFTLFYVYQNNGPVGVSFPPSDPVPAPIDESLKGAIDQVGALAPAPTYVVSEKGPDPPKPNPKEEEKKKKLEEKKKEEEAKKKKQKEADDERKKKGPANLKKFGTFNVPKDITYSPDGPRPDQIIILTASDGKGHNGGIEDLVGQTKRNREEYAQKHGYHYHFINITDFDIGGAHPVWAKLPAIIKSFNTYPDAQWLWWLDLDALIMTDTIDLSKHILAPNVLKNKLLKEKELIAAGGIHTGVFTAKEPNVDDIDLLFSMDQNGPNAGSFFIRRSEFSRMFVDMWGEPLFVDQNWMGQEQDAATHLFREHPVVFQHVGLVSMREFNAYALPGHPEMGWADGDLCIHFAGCWVKDECQERWQEYSEKLAKTKDAEKQRQSAQQGNKDEKKGEKKDEKKEEKKSEEKKDVAEKSEIRTEESKPAAQ